MARRKSGAFGNNTPNDKSVVLPHNSPLIKLAILQKKDLEAQC